jgi:hypothetical protein
LALIDQDAAQLIIRHNLTGAVARLIPANRTPTEPEKLILAVRRRQVMQVMQVVAAAKKVNAILEATRLPHLFIKGPMLAVQAYGDWGSRSSCDLDLLVDPTDIDRIHDVLLAAGLSRSDGNPSAPNGIMQWCHCEVGYKGLPVPLDVHWRLDATPGLCDLPFSDVLVRSETVDLGGTQIPTFGKLDAWIFTAIHGTRSGWFVWKWFMDAYVQMVALSPAEQSEARAIARKAGARKAVELTEALVRECMTESSEAPAGDWATRKAALIIENTRTGQGPVSSIKDGLMRRSESMLSAQNPGVGIDSMLRAFGRTFLNPDRYNFRVTREIDLKE